MGRKGVIYIMWTAVFTLILILFFGNFSKKDSSSDIRNLSKRIQEEVMIEDMKVTSINFSENGEIPSKFTCDGKNVNPQLSLSKIPENAESLVLVVDDPDAPAGDWVHWLVWNIDPKTVEIEEGSVPEGAVQGLNDFEKNSYGGPCPPSGTHNYQFKLYALDSKLDLIEESTKGDLEKAMESHILDQSVLVGKYSRN